MQERPLGWPAYDANKSWDDLRRSKETLGVPVSFGGATKYGHVADEMTDIALKGGFFTVITLSIYRFWRKTKERRLVWRETRIGDDGFEYTGTPLELLIGFMIAVVFLGVWLAIANMGLAYIQLAAWQDWEASFILAPVLASPLIAFAMYRARRYRVLRTRWRGIRMGMDGSGIQFAIRWIGWTFLQIVTLGLATPWKTMALERYMTEHMSYGSARFSFVPRENAMRRLFLNALVPWIPIAGLAAAGAFFFLTSGDVWGYLEAFWEAIESLAEEENRSPVSILLEGSVGLTLIPLFLSYPLYLRYRSRELAELVSARRVEGVRFHCDLTWKATSNPWLARIARSILLGIPVWSIAFLIAGIALFTAFASGMPDLSVFAGSDLPDEERSAEFARKIAEITSNPLSIATAGFGVYLAYGMIIIFGIWLNYVVSFRRRITHLCEGTRVTGLESIEGVVQRSRTEQAESEGFADALDIGGL